MIVAWEQLLTLGFDVVFLALLTDVSKSQKYSDLTVNLFGESLRLS